MTPRAFYTTSLRTPQHLELYLGANLTVLERMANDLAEGRRVEVVLLRSKGKKRVVTVPIDEAVKNVHRRILSMLTPLLMELPETVTGYVRGRSSIDNARAHLGADFLQKFDLVDFFAHINVYAISLGLRSVGFQDTVADVLARLTTCQGVLPAGFSTSPAMANLASRDLDAQLLSIAESHKLTVTRYADDITFSGQRPFDIRSELTRVAQEHGHSLNEEKFRALKQGQPMYVTGLSISELDGPRLPRPFKRKLRQELYYISARGLAEHAAWCGAKVERVRFRLGGQLAYATAVEPEWVAKMERDFAVAYSQVARLRSPRSDAKRRGRLVLLASRVMARDDQPAARYMPTITI